MPLIVNLSSLHTLDLEKSIDAFASLCDKYSDNTGCCGGDFFGCKSSKLWIKGLLWFYEKRLITPYKFGKLSSQAFFDNLLEIFPFLIDEDCTFWPSHITPINQQRETLIATRGKEILTKKDYACALLELAWNAMIDYQDNDVNKFNVLTANKDDPIYLISNTNELHAHHILNLLKTNLRDINWIDKPDISIKESQEPIEIAPNIYLCLSYRYQSFKTLQANQQAQVPTPSLLRMLVQSEGIDKSNTHVISQYKGDRTEAKSLGIPDNQVHNSEECFTTEPQHEKTA